MEAVAGDETAHLIAPLAARIRAAAPPDRRLVVLIDGHTGAGKTELATALAAELDALIVSLDDFYPGWGGLEVGSAMVRRLVDPVDPGYRRWDWIAHAPGEWVPVPLDRALVIEGSGSLSAANRELADYAVWVRLDPVTRRERTVARDGERFLEHWDRWAAQEHAFFVRERPDRLADAVLAVKTGELLFPGEPSAS